MKTIENPTIRLFHVPSFGPGPLKGPGSIPPQSSVEVSDEYFEKLTSKRVWKQRLDGTRIRHPQGAAGVLEHRILARRNASANPRAEAAESRAQAMEARVAELEAKLAKLAGKSSKG